MSSGESLRSRVVERVEQEQRRELEQAEQRKVSERLRAERAVRDAALVEAKAQLDARRTGTSPEDVFGPEKAQLCAEFIELMREHEFAGSLLLHDTPPSPTRGVWSRLFSRLVVPGPTEEPEWSIRGYGIARVNNNQRLVAGRRDPKGHTLQYNVFLCEDGQLRYKNGRVVESMPLNSYDPERLADVVEGGTKKFRSDDGYQYSEWTEMLAYPIEDRLMDIATQARRNAETESSH